MIRKLMDKYRDVIPYLVFGVLQIWTMLRRSDKGH